MVDIEGILEEVVVKVIGHASRKNAFWLISMDRDCNVAHQEVRTEVQTKRCTNSRGVSIKISWVVVLAKHIPKISHRVLV
jgi:hypothetical protein